MCTHSGDLNRFFPSPDLGVFEHGPTNLGSSHFEKQFVWFFRTLFCIIFNRYKDIAKQHKVEQKGSNGQVLTPRLY